MHTCAIGGHPRGCPSAECCPGRTYHPQAHAPFPTAPLRPCCCPGASLMLSHAPMSMHPQLIDPDRCPVHAAFAHLIFARSIAERAMQSQNVTSRHPFALTPGLTTGAACWRCQRCTPAGAAQRRPGGVPADTAQHRRPHLDGCPVAVPTGAPPYGMPADRTRSAVLYAQLAFSPPRNLIRDLRCQERTCGAVRSAHLVGAALVLRGTAPP